MFTHFAIKYWLCIALLAVLTISSAQANISLNEDFIWENGLRERHFGQREIIVSDEIITLKAPVRAEDATVVPIKIKAAIAQTEARFIKTIFLVIDHNPGPLAGKFHFTPKSGRADLALRVRVNAFTPIRAIAETNDGKLYMSKRFVRASGGCSVPVNPDLNEALSQAGKMRLRTHKLALNKPSRAQLNISHPNITGMQLDLTSKTYIPAHFVNHMTVTYNDTIVMTAETDLAISTDPSFSFFFVPEKPGTLKIELIDNKKQTYSRVFAVQPKH